MFDLEALDPQLRAGLRESLLSALSTYAVGGTRVVLTQLCLALADLALQLPDWPTVVTDMMERFGRTPATVPTLLGFLTVFAQENVQARFRVQVRIFELRRQA